MTPEPSPESHEISPTQPYLPGVLAKLEGTTGAIFSLDWSPDSRLLAWAAAGQIKVWDAIIRQETTTFPAHPMDIWGLAWSPDGSSLASAGQDGSVKVWNTASWKKTADLDTGEWAFCAAWSPDGKRLAVGTAAFTDPSRPETFSGTSQLWEMGTHPLVRKLGVSSFVISTAWSPDGRTIACGQWDGKVTLWDGETDTPLKTLVATTERSDVNGLAYSPDGRLLASAHQDGKVRIWDPETGELRMTMESHNGWFRGVTWSPDGKMLAAAGEDAEIRVWRTHDVRTNNGQVLADLTAGSLPIWCLKWSPDGNWLAAGNGIFTGEAHASQVLIYPMPEE